MLREDITENIRDMMAELGRVARDGFGLIGDDSVSLNCVSLGLRLFCVVSVNLIFIFISDSCLNFQKITSVLEITPTRLFPKLGNTYEHWFSLSLASTFTVTFTVKK